MNRRIVLASSSPWRREMLERVRLKFTCHPPDIDETPLPGENAEALAARLSFAKAKAVATAHPDALIIGSDQAGDFHGDIIGKPGNRDAAARQLRRFSGGTMTLYSGVALYDTADGKHQSAVEKYEVAFRDLDDEVIERYLRAEHPEQCCGGLKAEGLGIALLKRLRGDDPNTLIGMPLIRLIDMLRAVGVEPVILER